MTSSLGFKPHYNFVLEQFKSYKLVVLFFGLAIWVFIPIVGIFPLLLFVQLNLLSQQKHRDRSLLGFGINNIVLLLVALTITIFVSSFNIWGDTSIYIWDYKNLDITGIFGVKKYGSGWEFMTFLLAYPTFILSNGSEFWFLFNHCLIINLLITFVISQSFSKNYYPLLLIFIFSTNLYYGQVFYMRHFLSNVFLMLAIASLNNSRYIIGIFASIFSHLSNIIFSLVSLLFILDERFLNIIAAIKKQKVIFNILVIGGGIGFVVLFRVFGSSPFLQFLTNAIDLGINSNGDLGGYLQSRVSGYDGRLLEEEYRFPVMAVIDTLIIGGLILYRNLKTANKTLLSLVGIYFINLLGFIFVMLTGFNWRVCLLFFSLTGFFYLIALDIRNRDIQLALISWAVLRVFYFFFWLYRMNSNSYFVFFDGEPLNATIYDYLVFLFNSIIT